MTVIKICGITAYEDALYSAQCGANLLGFNFYKKSPRYISPEAAMVICDRLRAEMGADCPGLVGVFVNEVVGTISAITRKAGINFAQLSGDESDVMLKELRGIGFKAIRPANVAQAVDDAGYYAPYMPANDRIPSLLLDAYNPKLYGGTGEQAGDDIALAVKAKVPRLMLAGGLTPENVAARIRAVHPWGVDVASGVESEPGKKDPGKIRAFIEAIEGA